MPRIPNVLPSIQGFNSALLKDSPSSANMANYADIFNGPSEGHVPTAWESESAGKVADMAETAMGAGPAVDAFRQQARARNMQGLEDKAMQEADYFAHGLDRGMTHANVENQVADVNSEAAAARHMMPEAATFENQQHGRRMEMLDAQYGIPAQARAQEALAAANVAAQGRVQAAEAMQAPKQQGEEHDALTGYRNAIQAILEKTGRYPDGPTDAMLKTLYHQNAPAAPAVNPFPPAR